MTEPSRPMIRYHGGKWMLAPWVISHFPQHRVYVEPYGGGASVLLRKPRAYAEVYNDLFGDVVNLFRVMQDPVTAAQLREKLYLTPFAREEFYRGYALTEDPVEMARYTIIRSHMGHGNTGVTQKARTGFRSNSNRSGTTPAHDWANYPDAIPAYVERLRGVVIENRPAIDVMRRHDRVGTLHYVDPPYVHSTRGFSKRYAWEMDDDDHRTLAAALHDLKGMVVVAGYDSPLYSELYADWKRVSVRALADGAREREEVMWISPAAEAGRQPRLIA